MFSERLSWQLQRDSAPILGTAAAHSLGTALSASGKCPVTQASSTLLLEPLFVALAEQFDKQVAMLFKLLREHSKADTLSAFE
jgi:hypothetical protein